MESPTNTDRDRFFNLSRDLLCVAGMDGYFKELNPSWERTLGWSKQELMAEPWIEFVHPQDRKPTANQRKKLKQGQSVIQFINRYIHKDGSYKWLSWTSYPVPAEKKFYAVARDVTDRLLAEEKIQILAKFPEENPNPVLRICSDGTVHYSNPASKKLLSLYGELEHWLPEPFFRQISKAIKTNKKGVEIRFGEQIYHFTIYPVSDSNSIYLYGQDVTSQKYYQEQLKLSASVFENAIEGIIITDDEGTMQMVNKAFTDITGYSEKEAVGKNPRILKSDRHDDTFYKDMWNTLINSGQWSGEIWNRRKNGEAYPQWISINSVKDYTAKLSHYIAIFYDITEKKIQEEKLEYQAYHDALTGLPNRQLFRDRLEMIIASGKRKDIRSALLLIDLDDFKKINDTFGHPTGDSLLIEAANRFQDLARSSDTVARIGGDEFVIFLTDIKEPEDSIEFARRLIESYAEPFQLSNYSLYSNLSIGITVFPDDAENADDLIRNADMALYRAKQSGKNTYYPYTPNLMETALKRFNLETKLRSAIKENSFQIYYQPKLDLMETEIIGVEALIRWPQENGSFVSPADFIPLAESTGLIHPIGEWVMRTACSEVLKWIKAGRSLSLAVNLSAKQFFSEQIIEDIKRILSETEFPPNLLNLEITENAAVSNTELTIEIMRELTEMGISFSLDDFGTGYSSLSYLKKFPLSVIKVDKSFVTGIPNDQDDVSITKAVISMGKSLNLTVVAEGVETEEQRSFLTIQGCDEIQGYLIGKPMDRADFTDFILDKN